MPIVKNRLFQPLGVMLSDGRMLHFQSREEREVAAAELNAPHLKSLIAAGQLALRESDRRRSAAPPRAPAPAPEPAAALVPESAASVPQEPADEVPRQTEHAEEPDSRRHKGRKGPSAGRHKDDTE